MENTYQLELPQLFQAHLAQKIIEKELEKHLHDVKTYDPELCRTKSVQIANSIRKALKGLGIKR